MTTSIRSTLALRESITAPYALGIFKRGNTTGMEGDPKAIRLLNLLRDLTATRKGRTKKELAEEHGIDKRTVERDLRDIEAFAVLKKTPHPSGSGEMCYAIEPEADSPFNVALTPDEGFLFAYCMAVARREALPRDRQALDSLRAKVEGLLPKSLHQHADRLARLYVAVNRPVPNREWDLDTLRELEDAITSKEWIRFEYESRDGESSTRVVAPCAILTYQGRLYLLARSEKHIHDRPAKFAVSRIRNVDILDGEADRIPPDVNIPDEDENPTDLIGDSFGLYDEEPFELEVLFSGEAVESVTRTTFHPSQKVEILPDGRAHLTLKAGGYYEMLWWILGFGDKAEVVRPERMRDEIQGILTRICTAYQKIETPDEERT